ncbi:MAG: hypothetical protein KFF50_10310 [Desulfatitalea sp.]|nr:hypothetical protein [Desulfatitalea sp.]
MTTRQGRTAPGALDLTEAAVRLLRQTGAAGLAEYYIGTLPFLLGLLFFWADMSRNPYADHYLAPAAGGMALLFIWMKVWQVRFCRRLWSALHDSAPEPWPWQRCWRTALRQAAVQATGLVVLPIAALIVLPMAWVYAFYQNLTVLDAPGTRPVKALTGEAWQQAVPWPGQNHLLLTLISVFGLMVLLNLIMALMLLPYLGKWLLDIETPFTISGLRAMTNTTFLTAVCALTYACIDPLIKAAYTLRCFHTSALNSGADLHAAIKPFLKTTALLVLWGAMAVAVSLPQAGAAADGPTAGAAQEAYARQLDETIDRVLQERRFAWRLPREKPAAAADEDPQGWIARAFRWLADPIAEGLAAVDRWMEAIADWLGRRFPQPEQRTGGGRDWRPLIRLLFYLTGALLLVLLLLGMRRWWMTRRPADHTAAALLEPRVDIHDETLTAGDLPSDRWHMLARQLMARNDLRAALRALYLSMLAQLGDSGHVAIARFKSNRDYRDELVRRAHAEPELLACFTRCMTAFERAWYGMHPVAETQLSDFITDQERIAALVQPTA